MKRKLLAILSIPLLLSSCSFISIKENSVPQSEISIEILKEEKDKYIERIYEICDYDLYFPDTWHQLDLVKQECINRINEASDITSLKDIFDECIEYIDANIESIKCYINRKIDEINIESLLVNYLNAEQQLINKRYRSLVNNIEQLKTKAEISSSINSFLSYIKTLKAKRDYINEYSEKLDSYLKDNIFESEYYSSEIEEILEIVSEYNNLISFASSLHELDFLLNEAIDKISNVDPKIVVDQKIADKTIDICYQQLLELGLSKEKCDLIKSEMKDCDNVFSNIMLIYIRERIEYISDHVEDENEKLILLKDLKIQALQYLFLRSDIYSTEGLDKINNSLANWIDALNSSLDIDEMNSKYSDAIADLSKIDVHLSEIEKNILSLETSVSSLTSDKYIYNFKKYEANDYYEFASIIDGYLFYQLENDTFLRDTFDVKVNFPYHNPTHLRNIVYWYCRLVRNVADMQFSENNGFIRVTLTAYKQASENDWDLNKEVTKYKDLVSHRSNHSFTDRPDDFSNFPYLSQDKQEVLCWNSQQLWYAFERGYKPIVKPNSKAEIVMNKAKSILRKIIKEEMDEKDKIFAIYQWFGQNTIFDWGIYNHYKSTDMDNYPAQELAKYDCFYAEGPLIDGLSVCSGFSKAYLILLSIEGIRCKNIMVRSRLLDGINTINTSSVGMGYHEFTIIYIDDKMLYSDAEKSFFEHNMELSSWVCSMSTIEYMRYGNYKNINPELVSPDNFASYMLEDLVVDNNSIFVKNKEDIKKIVPSIEKLNHGEKLSIIYDKEQYKNAKNDLLEMCSKHHYIEYDLYTPLIELVIYN